MKNITFIFTFILVLCCTVQHAQAQNLEADKLALETLYNECGGTSWVGFDNWLSEDVSTWEGVTVSNVGGVDRVTHVNFIGMQLTGTLPEELGNMTAMSGKIEFHNQPGLTGVFPAFIWNWTGVTRLQIKWCGFSSIDVNGIEAMVNLYEINTQGTPFAGEIPVEIFELPLMKDVYLEDGMWTSLPADMPIPTPIPLRRFYLNGNQFTDLPDLTGMIWATDAKVKIYDNQLTFEDIEPNMWIASDVNVAGFTYSPQGIVGNDMYVYGDAGTEVTLQSGIGGSSATVFTWIKGVDEVVGDTKDLTLAAFNPATETGSYFCVGQNTNVPGLDIYTGKKMLFESPLAQDKLALETLYNECGGASWIGYDNWLSEDVSTWEGVTVSNVDGIDRVTHVNFIGMQLTGTLPEELGNMTAMSGKIEFHNQPGLTGVFPAFIWNWTGMTRLQIKWCGFSSIDVAGIEAMVNLYEINTQGTPFAGELPVEIFNLPLMRDVYLEDGMWTSLPADMPIPTPTPLRRFYLNGNQFTDLPDLTGMIWATDAKVKIYGNQLTFEDIEPNMWIASDVNVAEFTFSPQGFLPTPGPVTVAEGDEIVLSTTCGGSQNIYTWLKDGEVIDGEETNVLRIESSLVADAGDYQCYVQSTLVPGLDLSTDVIVVEVSSATSIHDASEKTIVNINGNPVHDELSIDTEELVETIAIFNVAGQMIREEKVNTNQIRMNVSDLKNGMYVVVLKGKLIKSTLRIVKK